MKKDFTRDYITEAFRRYSAMGKPTYAEAEKSIYETELSKWLSSDPGTAVAHAEAAVDKQAPLLLDTLAVEKTIEILKQSGKAYISAAVAEIYFVNPLKPLSKGEISVRVRRYAAKCPTDERTVYRWLKEARLLCAAIRGLCIASMYKDVSSDT